MRKLLYYRVFALCVRFYLSDNHRVEHCLWALPFGSSNKRYSLVYEESVVCDIEQSDSMISGREKFPIEAILRHLAVLSIELL